jgi:hypothetical protein
VVGKIDDRDCILRSIAIVGNVGATSVLRSGDFMRVYAYRHFCQYLQGGSINDRQGAVILGKNYQGVPG